MGSWPHPPAVAPSGGIARPLAILAIFAVSGFGLAVRQYHKRTA
ncbi:MAG: hypothetical protein ABI836_15350 [Gemmatimonadota bacterium]